MMDKQINLFRNVFNEEQAARRRIAIGAFAFCLLALCGWAASDHAKRAERANQDELATIEAALQIERTLVDTLSKAQKERGRDPDNALNQLRARELEQVLKEGGAALWSGLDSLLSAWSVAGTRFKKISLEKNVVVITGEALTQDSARVSLERISSMLAAKELVRAMKVEFKASESVVTFTMTGTLEAGGGHGF